MGKHRLINVNPNKGLFNLSSKIRYIYDSKLNSAKLHTIVVLKKLFKIMKKFIQLLQMNPYFKANNKHITNNTYLL